ncbi:MAG: hypothetical protein L0Y76_02835 [Ignavibacteria bacterium]|nr:hypothetical protein [Ignavibacteria bacterium]
MHKIFNFRLASFALLQVVFLLFFSCTNIAQNNWEKLVYYYNAGALPPPYHYHYTISISKDGQGELLHTSGYADNGKNTSKYSFVLSDKELNQLVQAVNESGVLNSDIKQRPGEEIPDGGHSDGLTFYSESGDAETENIIKTVPSYPDLKYEKILNKLYSVIIKCVPDDIWNKVNAREE